jgi:hypothetical protein
MEQRPSRQAHCDPGSQILRLLQKTKVHYSILKRQPLIPILSEINPIHNLTLSLVY